MAPTTDNSAFTLAALGRCTRKLTLNTRRHPFAVLILQYICGCAASHAPNDYQRFYGRSARAFCKLVHTDLMPWMMFGEGRFNGLESKR